jgi:alpha-glucosidase
MQWNAEPHAGFTSGEPWLPLAPDYREVNVAVQRDAAHSMLRLYAGLIALRRGEPALEIGRFEMVETSGDLLAYIRRARREESEFLVALNLGAEPRSLSFAGAGNVALSTHLDRWLEPVTGEVSLRPDEGVIVRLDRA